MFSEPKKVLKTIYMQCMDCRIFIRFITIIKNMYELQRRNATFSKLKELLKTKCCKLTANREILPAPPK